MKYINTLPQHKYPWLPTLYSMVLDIKPNSIVEYGTALGGTAIVMGLALRELQETENHQGIVHSYDTFEHQSKGEIGSNPSYNFAINHVAQYGLADIVKVSYGDFFDFCADPSKKFDLLYFDIDNDGDKVLEMYEGCKKNIEEGAIVIFEGGSIVRDNVPWMIELKRKKINETKQITHYHLLTPDQKYSCSIIFNPKLYNFSGI